MNILLFDASERLDERRIRIGGRRVENLKRMAGEGELRSLRVGEINGRIGAGEIEELGEDSAILCIELTRDPPPKLPVTLVLALPRPKMLRRILRSIAEFGVGELHLINTYRVEKSFWQTPVLEPESLRNYLELGLEQAVDTVLPPVHLHRRFKPWVEDEFPSLLAGKRGIVAHPGEHPPCPANLSEDMLLSIGPEGGFTPFELEKFQAAGCKAVSLGPRILRVENAVSALLARCG